MMTETKSGAGRAMPDANGPVAEVKTALEGFLSEFSTFQTDIQAKLHKQEVSWPPKTVPLFVD